MGRGTNSALLPTSGRRVLVAAAEDCNKATSGSPPQLLERVGLACCYSLLRFKALLLLLLQSSLDVPSLARSLHRGLRLTASIKKGLRHRIGVSRSGRRDLLGGREQARAGRLKGDAAAAALWHSGRVSF